MCCCVDEENTTNHSSDFQSFAAFLIVNHLSRSIILYARSFPYFSLFEAEGGRTTGNIADKTYFL